MHFLRCTVCFITRPRQARDCSTFSGIPPLIQLALRMRDGRIFLAWRELCARKSDPSKQADLWLPLWRWLIALPGCPTAYCSVPAVTGEESVRLAAVAFSDLRDLALEFSVIGQFDRPLSATKKATQFRNAMQKRIFCL